MKLSKIILTAGLLVGAAAVAFAGPSSTSANSSRAMTAEQMEQLKAGDQIAYVCKQCDSITVQSIEKPGQAMALCKEGARVTCPSCKKDYKVMRKGSGKNGTPYTEVSYVNARGEACMFVAKLQK